MALSKKVKATITNTKKAIGRAKKMYATIEENEKYRAKNKIDWAGILPPLQNEVIFTMRVVLPLDKTAKLLYELMAETELKDLIKEPISEEKIRHRLSGIQLHLPQLYDLGEFIDNRKNIEMMMEQIPQLMKLFKAQKAKRTK